MSAEKRLGNKEKVDGQMDGWRDRSREKHYPENGK